MAVLDRKVVDSLTGGDEADGVGVRVDDSTTEGELGMMG